VRYVIYIYIYIYVISRLRVNVNINIFNISQYSRDTGMAILTFTFPLTVCDVGTPVKDIRV
jgi:hypothetical protein